MIAAHWGRYAGGDSIYRKVRRCQVGQSHDLSRCKPYRAQPIIMSNEFKVEEASRVGVVPLIDLYAESGCGKTFSALLLARGIAGPDGLIVGVDTENRRMSLYADVIPGGFKVINFDHPFAPDRYIAALQVAFDMKPAVVVVDSMSHEWEGIGGTCDMAAENEAKSGRPGLHNWKKPKVEHQMLVQFLLRSPCPIICCIRAKYKTRQKKGTQAMADNHEIRQNQVGQTIIIKDEMTSPIQAEDFIFEATAHMEVLQNHNVIVTKCNHPRLRECFPADNTSPITIEHGKLVAQWCQNPDKKPVAQTVGKKSPKAVLLERFTQLGLTALAQAYAIDRALILPTDGLDAWPEDKVPKSKEGFDLLIREIKAHQ